PAAVRAPVLEPRLDLRVRGKGRRARGVWRLEPARGDQARRQPGRNRDAGLASGVDDPFRHPARGADALRDHAGADPAQRRHREPGRSDRRSRPGAESLTRRTRTQPGRSARWASAPAVLWPAPAEEKGAVSPSFVGSGPTVCRRLRGRLRTRAGVESAVRPRFAAGRTQLDGTAVAEGPG